MSEQLILNLVVVIGSLILSITVHEYAHGLMAYLLGDDTAKKAGRLTLDPTKHIDPVWTIALPAIMIAISTVSGGMGIPLFAAGKPTPYNPAHLKGKYAELLIAIAGPLANLAMAFVSLVLMLMVGARFEGLLNQFLYLNIALFVFNLIPVPPLDGSKVLVALLSRKAAEKYEMMGAQLSWVLLGVLIFGGGAFISHAIHTVVSGMTWLLI